jgi:RNA polymerase-binding transcription factor DksA
MIKNQMETFRPQLLKLAQHLRGDVATLEDEAFHETDGMAMDNLSNIPVEDRAERGADNYSEETTIGLLENESERLGEINAALERIGVGTPSVAARNAARKYRKIGSRPSPIHGSVWSAPVMHKRKNRHHRVTCRTCSVDDLAELP